MTKDDFVRTLISRKESIEWEYTQSVHDIPPSFTSKYAQLKVEENSMPYRVQLNIVKVHSYPSARYFLCIHSESTFLGLIEECDLADGTLLQKLYHESPTLLDQELERIAMAPMWPDI